MNKRIAVSMICLSLILSACGDLEAADTETTTIENEEQIAGAVGIYVGDDGSYFTLYEDGTADYYWEGYDSIQHENTWSVDDGEIKIKLPGLYCTVSADISSKGSIYRFESSSIFWNDETFEKVATESRQLDIDGYLEIKKEATELFAADRDPSTNDTETVVAADDTSSDEFTTDTTVETSEETIAETASAIIAEEAAKIVDETDTASSDYPELYVSDLTVSAMTDYAHAFDDVYLGEGEGVTIRIHMPEGTTSDEILVLGDDEMLNISQQSEEGARLTFYITGKKTGVTELYITTCYELDTKGEQATCRTMRIHKLNSSEGRLVYVTPNGDKYHNSASCAGENATKTTYHDCTALEYDPCGKCAR